MSEIILHGYWRSSAVYRVRIALNLKHLDYQQIGHDLRTGEQNTPAYKAIAPAGLVPAVEHAGQVYVQSLAIIEWLEERWPNAPLLPGAIEQRAIVRAMATTIAADIHPLNNLRILKYLKKDFEREQEQIDSWVAHWIGEGFAALEVLIDRHGDGYAFGEFPTMADCFLVPQVYNAERFGIDLTPFPKLTAAAEKARAHPAFAAAHPDLQPGAETA
ncbi:MAG TPA: maleylacetoacetate isomerase [Sphingomonas sp.]|uniref:maleylacetoacetate isomerase n=1 Tax=Sphingomonas sp. TaxID=28214 RepID=UPI002CC687DD|nr:maleylacetoacetate isomerase [Sphingomonas sp.]HMI18671.1 maleylacetoacetate isomerase [Sphingomonas sp.]